MMQKHLKYAPIYQMQGSNVSSLNEISQRCSYEKIEEFVRWGGEDYKFLLEVDGQLQINRFSVSKINFSFSKKRRKREKEKPEKNSYPLYNNF